MPQPRKLDETMLLFWSVQGVTTVEMQKRLAESGTTASVDLIRLRLRKRGGMPRGSRRPRSRSGSRRRPTGVRPSSPRPSPWSRR